MAIQSSPHPAAPTAPPVVPIDEATRHSIERLGEWAHTHAADYGLRLEKMRARRWQSIEDPDWVMVVIDLTVTGDYEAGQRFWDGAGDRLETLVEAQATPPSAELVTDAHWPHTRPR